MTEETLEARRISALSRAIAVLTTEVEEFEEIGMDEAAEKYRDAAETLKELQYEL